VDQSYVFQLIEALAQGDGAAVCALCEVLRAHGLSAASALEDMAGVLQRMAVCQVSAVADDDTDPDAARITALAAVLPPDETQLLYSLCLHGRADLGLAPDEYAALTMVLLRLLAFKPAAVLAAGQAQTQEKKSLNSPAPGAPPGKRVPLRDSAPAEPGLARASAQSPVDPVRQEMDLERDKQGQHTEVPWQGEDATEPAPAGDAHLFDDRQQPEAAAVPATRVIGIPVRSASPVAPEPPAAASLEPTEEGAFWHAVVQPLVDNGAIQAMVRELALQSQLVARDEGLWLLRVERESLNQPANRERLAGVLRTAGYAVDLAVEIGRVSDCPARRNSAASQGRLDAARHLIESDPFVQRMVRDFGAKIVPGSVRPL
jgi:DNA polymerase-3 subunit gamma/tau